MNRIYALVLFFMASLLIWPPQHSAAQGNQPQLAYVNASGQLVVASADGNLRWIATNPGEVLAPEANVTWSPDGSQLVFAIQAGGQSSLRLGNPNTQSVVELAALNGSLRGGEWPSNQQIVAGTNQGLTSWTTQGAATLLAPDAFPVSGQTFANNGQHLIFWRNGTNAVAPLGGTGINIPGTSDPNARGVGLWATNAPFVAAWGTGASGASVLTATNASTGEVLSLDSGSSLPVTPLAWVPGTSQLIFRSPDAVRIADVGCLAGGCAQNPLEASVPLISASAADVMPAGGGWVIYRDGAAVQAVNTTCVSSNACLSSAIALGDGLQNGTSLYMGGNTLVYTAGSGASLINLTCLNNNACGPQSLGAGLLAGPVSDDGRFVVTASNAGELSILQTDTLASVPLGSAARTIDTFGRARWN